ncbi:MAG: type II toxin-antitoxin system RelE/ParE family toxin [Candidatus Caenarcaniphilales bacterium]|nr:type II toxin-antitoxin system RelE/ParE family toxin [Candidatus Caenarcaniphilales bacterium]
MAWKIEYDSHAFTQFKKLDFATQKQIDKYLRKIEKAQEPRAFGKPLSGQFSGFWRYRVGDYRLICKIEDQKLIIVILEVEHRKKVYKRK